MNCIVIAGYLDISDSGDHLRAIAEVPVGGDCTIYLDGPGGDTARAMALADMIVMRSIKATGVVLGECSSGMLLPFAACSTRLVTPRSMFLFHKVRSGLEQAVSLAEAESWVGGYRVFNELFTSRLGELFRNRRAVNKWINEERYVTGKELVVEGMAEFCTKATIRGIG